MKVNLKKDTFIVTMTSDDINASEHRERSSNKIYHEAEEANTIAGKG